jgi:hypothetical protein
MSHTSQYKMGFSSKDSPSQHTWQHSLSSSGFSKGDTVRTTFSGPGGFFLCDFLCELPAAPTLLPWPIFTWVFSGVGSFALGTSGGASSRRASAFFASCASSSSHSAAVAAAAAVD